MWRELLNIAAPAAATLASNNPRRSGVLQGYLGEQDRLAEEARRKQAHDEAKSQNGAKFLMDVSAHLSELDDPVQFEQVRSLYKQVAPMMGAPVDGLDRVAFNHNKETLKQQKDAQAAVDALKASTGRTDAELYGQNVRLKDGRVVKFNDLHGVAYPTLLDDQGEPQRVSAAPKPEGSTEDERRLDKWARETKNKPLSKLTSAEYEEGRKVLGIGAPPVRPPAAPRTPVMGSFEDYVKRAFGDNPSPEQIRQARKDYQQADDRPQSSGDRSPGGLTPNQESLLTERLAKNWMEITKPTREMNRQLGIMNAGVDRFKSDPNGASQAVLVTFQKILDPTSVVRESEYARSAEGISLMGRIEGYFERLKAGGAGVRESDLKAMADTAREFVTSMQNYADGTRRRIEAQAKKYGIDPVTIFDDVPNVPAAAAAPARGGVSVQAPDGQTYTFPDQASANRFKAAAGIR